MEDSVKKKGKFHFKGERTRSTLIIVAVLVVYVVSIHLNIHWLYTIITALVSAGVTYELVHAVGAESKLLFGVTITVSAAYVVTVGFHIRLPHPTVLLSFYVMLLLALLMRRKIQGYTGDCCGATFLLCEMSFYLSVLIYCSIGG